ncbi:unnamed protein product, partial [Didymodactylos carnosus]
MIYMILRHLTLSWRDTDQFLSSFGTIGILTCHKWAKTFLCEDFNDSVSENRGGKHTDGFYDVFPQLEIQGRAFVVDVCAQKSSSFKAADLATFIDERYYKINNLKKSANNLIRSIESCRLDVRRWGGRHEANSNRPYFEGHERADIIAHRKEFIQHFLSRKAEYYTITNDESPKWVIRTTPRRTILICHDESTFRSGEISPHRWIIDDNAPFFSKGRSRSHMLSDFLVLHPSPRFFRLNQEEWNEATKKYPELLQDSDITYEKHSASAAINIGGDLYMDNSLVLEQFERFFNLLQFKKEYKDHSSEILVDNARTHTKRQYSLHDFGKSPGTRCPVPTIEFTDNKNVKQTVNCYFTTGNLKGQSKGLLNIALDLGIRVPVGCKLDELKALLLRHPTFKNVTKLEKLASEFGVKALYGPKYHCELKPIE